MPDHGETGSICGSRPWLHWLVCSWLSATLFWPALASARSAFDPAAFFDHIQTLSGHFDQSSTSDSNDRHLSGDFLVLRPNRFRWEYRKPYRQTIIVDGQRLMIYDEDLAQLTIKPMAAGMATTGPAVLLSSDRPIATLFKIEPLPPRHDGLDWFELTPRQDDEDETGFERIRLAMTASGLDTMVVYDRLGNRTEIRFSQMRTNQPIDENRFVFTPPPGTDVIDETAP